MPTSASPARPTPECPRPDRVGRLRRRHGYPAAHDHSASLGTLVQDGSTLNVNGKTITFKNAAAPLAANVPTGSGVSGNLVTDGNGNSTVFLQGATLADTLNAIDLATGVQTATNRRRYGNAGHRLRPGRISVSPAAR